MPIAGRRASAAGRRAGRGHGNGAVSGSAAFDRDPELLFSLADGVVTLSKLFNRGHKGGIMGSLTGPLRV